MRRSSTTDANVLGVSPVSRDRRADPQHVAADGGGQHVRHELAGQVVATRGAAGRRAGRGPRAPAASARPRARAPTSVSTIATASHSDGAGVSSGMTSSRSIGGMRQTRIAEHQRARGRCAAPSDTACFRFTRPSPRPSTVINRRRAYRRSDLASVRWLARRLGGRPGPSDPPDDHHHAPLGGSMFRKLAPALVAPLLLVVAPVPRRPTAASSRCSTGDAAVSALRSAPGRRRRRGHRRVRDGHGGVARGRDRSRWSPPAPTTPTPSRCRWRWTWAPLFEQLARGRARSAARGLDGPWRWSSTATPSTCGLPLFELLGGADGWLSITRGGPRRHGAEPRARRRHLRPVEDPRVAPRGHRRAGGGGHRGVAASRPPTTRPT